EDVVDDITCVVVFMDIKLVEKSLKFKEATSSKMLMGYALRKVKLTIAAAKTAKIQAFWLFSIENFINSLGS
ncbi:MAG: hypothetical protein ACPGYI_04065, partial [Flavobacteriaceae bacterium]